MALPNWLIIVAAMELISLLIFGLNIAIAIPEGQIIGGSRAQSNAG